MPPQRRAPSHGARSAPYTPRTARPAYRPRPQVEVDTTPTHGPREKIVCEPRIPTYQKGEADIIGTATKNMHMKMLPAYADNQLFEEGLDELGAQYTKKMHDKQDKHYLITVFSPEYRDMVVNIQSKLPNTTFPAFDKTVFNTRTLSDLQIDMIFQLREDGPMKDIIIIGSPYLYNVRNLIFKQNKPNTPYKYGTYYNMKGYMIAETNDVGITEEILIESLKQYGFRVNVYDGVQE